MDRLEDQTISCRHCPSGQALLILLVLLVGCGERMEGGASTAILQKDSSGSWRIDLNDSSISTYTLSQPSLTVGAVEGAPEHIFHDIRDVAAIDEHRFLVVDIGGRVAVFNGSGKWINDLGGRGDGPGEFQQPSSATAWNDTIAVWDLGRRIVQEFSPSGELLSHTPILDHAIARPIEILRTGFISERESGQLRDPTPASGFLVRLSRDGQVEDTLHRPYSVPEYSWKIIDEESGRGHMVEPPVFSVWPQWAADDSVVVWGDPVSGEVKEVARPASNRALLSVSGGAEISSQARAAYAAAVGNDFGLDSATVAGIRTETTFAERQPAFTKILLDESQRLWLAGFSPEAHRAHYVGTTWTVVDTLDETAWKVRFPERVELFDIQNGRAYGTVTNELGVETAAVFELPTRQGE